ncbi:MAG: hypothetical protein GY797_38045 [Deltaproteobacteria bacterium]|nr:hypothetical protein [Deltaproteobacteria bacterium]
MLTFLKNLYKNNIFIAGIIGILIGFFTTHTFNYLQYNETIKQYREQTPPDIDIRYKFLANTNEHRFVIENTGLIDCIDVWANENIYLIINDEVYDGNDIPHYNFFVYDGSRTRMWDIKKGSNQEVLIDKLQFRAISDLKKKYNPIFITKWDLDYSSNSSSKRYHTKKFFIYDNNDYTFKIPKEYVGGLSLIEKVEDYVKSGKKQSMKIFILTGTFEIDPPPAILVNADYSITPLYPYSKVTINEFNDSLFFYYPRIEIQPSSEIVNGFLQYVWKYKDSFWDIAYSIGGKAQMHSKPLPTCLSYLSDEESEKVKKTPELLKYYDRERKVQHNWPTEIINIAKKKYLNENK